MSTKTKREVYENQRFEELYYDTGQNGYSRARTHVHNGCRVELVDTRWGRKGGILTNSDGNVIGDFIVTPKEAARAARGLPVKWRGGLTYWKKDSPEYIIRDAGSSASWQRESVLERSQSDPIPFTQEDTRYVVGAYSKFPQVLDDGDTAKAFGERALAAYRNGMSLDDFIAQEAPTS